MSAGRCRLVVATVVAFVLLTPHSASATWSIVGVDAERGEVGVAVASCVGFEVTVVPVLVPGVGAAASQASISEASGDRLVDAIVSGAPADDIVDAVVAADDAPDERQFAAVVLDGSAAGWSGANTVDVATDRRNPSSTASAQGNILVSAEVVDDALAAFDAAEGELGDRLIAALVAGADAGGDARCGAQTATAAALLIGSAGDEPYAHTDDGIFGVDPESIAAPSVFLSVLVERGAERAPDRLAEVWSSADRAAGPIMIRQVDDGADTAARTARRVVGLAFGVVALAAVGVVVLVLRNRRRAS